MEKKNTDAYLNDLRSQRKIEVIGQVFGFLIGVTAIVAGAMVAASGHQIAGSIIGGGTIAGLVSVFIMGRASRKEKDVETEASEGDQES